MKSDKKIIILAKYSFPCTHPVLENVFAKELGRNHELVWLLQGDIAKGKKQKWFNSQVLLTKKFQGGHWYIKTVNSIYAWHKIFHLLRLLSTGKGHIVLIRDSPFIAFVASMFRMFKSFRLFYQHSSPQDKISLAAFKFERGPKRVWCLIHGISYGFFLAAVLKKADIVFAISEFHKKELIYVTSEDKIVSLSMGIDKEWLKRDKNEIPYLKKIGKDSYLLTYFGTLSFTRNPIFILQIFAKVKEIISNCKLILIGKTNSDWELQELRITCRELGVEEDVIFCGFLTRNLLQDYLAYCDLSISAIPPEGYYTISSPTKVYESLGNGVPVVGNKEIDEQRKVISESGGGLVVDYKITSFCDAIIKILNKPELRKDMARRGRDYVIANYSYQNIAKKIAPYFDIQSRN